MHFKGFTAAMAALVVLALAGCGGGREATAANGSPSSSPSAAANASPTAAATTPVAAPHLDAVSAQVCAAAANAWSAICTGPNRRPGDGD
ncbi:hypothetical protein [Micromonospora chersina]|uniref:hypothetical protein n=1 Tax=Micromonospora chersina TaxID=47854 RepID=UPI0033C6C644